MYRHSSCACSHFSQSRLLSICMCTRNSYFDTSKDSTLFYLRPSLLNFTLKRTMNQAALLVLTTWWEIKKKETSSHTRNIVNYVHFSCFLFFLLLFFGHAAWINDTCNHKMKARDWVEWGMFRGSGNMSYCFCLCFLFFFFVFCEYHLIYVSARQSEHAD